MRLNIVGRNFSGDDCMQSWHDLTNQIFVGLVVNIIIGILCWIGKRELAFLKAAIAYTNKEKNQFIKRKRNKENATYFKSNQLIVTNI